MLLFFLHKVVEKFVKIVPVSHALISDVDEFLEVF